jgi:hypothetical protein
MAGYGGMPGAAPAGAAPAAAPGASGAGGSAPPEYGYNIGNLIAGNTPWAGKGQPYQLTPQLSFETFSTPEAGVAAAYKNIAYHYGRGATTFQQLAGILGPKDDGKNPYLKGNNPDTWAAAVSSAAGLKPTDAIPINDPQAMARVMRGINVIEKGRPTVPDSAYLAGVSGQPAASGTTPSPVQPTQFTPPAQGAPQPPQGQQPAAPAIDYRNDPVLRDAADAARIAQGRGDLKGFQAARTQAAKRVAEMQQQAQQNANREVVIGPDGKPQVNRTVVDAKKEIAQAGAQPAAESEALKLNAKDAAETASAMQASGLKSRSALANVKQLGSLLNQIETGKLTSTTTQIKAWGKALGIDIGTDNVGPAQAAQALIGQMALNLRDPSAGAGMPGAMSDADRQFLTNMVPNLETTPEGRRLMLSYMGRIHEYNIGLAKAVSDYRRSARWATDPQGIHQVAQDYAAQHPIFSEEDIQAAQRAKGANPVPTEPKPEPPAAPGGVPTMDAIDAEMKRRGLK